jgi:hypothetical protein
MGMQIGYDQFQINYLWQTQSTPNISFLFHHWLMEWNMNYNKQVLSYKIRPLFFRFAYVIICKDFNLPRDNFISVILCLLFLIFIGNFNLISHYWILMSTEQSPPGTYFMI